MDKTTFLQVEDLSLSVPYHGNVYPAVEHVSFCMAAGDSASQPRRALGSGCAAAGVGRRAKMRLRF